ncbi:glutathione-disulfide reductase [Saccharomycopsis crataegensis]|uniref:Glutathione-disulfide reductase n=1 Tax=Saccharomycopsis crataegensis TaxID=43959 RepID=A0AAV5QNZ2_9ASCO|nr:glutathione-disulfide reductase [Saccharomycopsis crataegensis]
MVEAKYLKVAKDLLAKHPYFLLAKSWCPDVKYAINTLKEHKKYDGYFYAYELDKLPDQAEAYRIEQAFTELAGRKWVPSIFVNGQYWGTEQDLKVLRSQDKLKETLDKLIV